jgi:hypothetical protein
MLILLLLVTRENIFFFIFFANFPYRFSVFSPFSPFIVYTSFVLFDIDWNNKFDFLMIAGISVWNEHSPRIESALAENKVEPASRFTCQERLYSCSLRDFSTVLGGERFEASTQGVV